MKSSERKEPPPGMVTPRVLRGLIRAVLRRLQNSDLTTQESIELLREQRRLAKQLEASTKAQERLASEVRIEEAMRKSGVYGDTEALPGDGSGD